MQYHNKRTRYHLREEKPTQSKSAERERNGIIVRRDKDNYALRDEELERWKD